MTDIWVCWAIIFQKEGLDVEAIKEYLSAENTTVVDVIEDTVTIGNHVTNVDKEIPCMIFKLRTEGTIFIPFKFRMELNLKETDQRYVYMPYE